MPLSLAASVKTAIRGTPLHRAYRRLVPLPVIPPVDYDRKRAIIVDYGRRFGLSTLVETGTCLGGTVQAVMPYFEAIHTVEISEPLYRESAARFASEPKVTCYQGDSARRLRDILPCLASPTLFWLDAHYSGSFEKDGRLVHTHRAERDTPIMDELDAILNHVQVPYVILIDDAREFDGKNDYPTLGHLRAFVSPRTTSVEVSEDIIQIHP